MNTKHVHTHTRSRKHAGQTGTRVLLPRSTNTIRLSRIRNQTRNQTRNQKRHFIYILPENYKGIRLTFDQYSADINSRVGILLAFIHSLRVVDAGIQRILINELDVVTSDKVEGVLNVYVEYQIIDPKKFLLNDLVVKEVLRDILKREITNIFNSLETPKLHTTRNAVFMSIVSRHTKFEKQWKFPGLVKQWRPKVMCDPEDYIVNIISTQLREEIGSLKSQDVKDKLKEILQTTQEMINLVYEELLGIRINISTTSSSYLEYYS